MEAIALKTALEGPFHATGRITGCADALFEVETPEGSFRVGRATSCLVQPELGDLAMVAGPHEGALYILAVLERPGSDDLRITGDGDLSVELGTGRLSFAASEGMELVSGGALSILASRLEARAAESSLFVGTLRVVGSAVDSAFERLTQRVKHSFRRIEGLDQVRSGEIDYVAENRARLHGEHTLVTARGLVKADGKQIHVG